MKIRTGDIYRIDMTKYKWANQFTIGKVLDITSGKYLNYSSSSLLLENNADEVWSIDYLDSQQHVTLRKINDEKITYQLKKKKDLDLLKFDTIIAFNILSVADNMKDILEFIFEHLDQNGTVIISIVNDDNLSDNDHDLVTKDLNLFSQSDFEKILKPYFEKVTFFSQGIFSQEDKKEDAFRSWIRSKIKKFFLKSIDRYNFYLKYFESTRKSIVKKNRSKENRKTQKYEITPFHDDKRPMFTIAKCKR